MVEKLDYLQSLGINCVELLPSQDFNELEYYSVSPQCPSTSDPPVASKNIASCFAGDPNVPELLGSWSVSGRAGTDGLTSAEAF